MSESELFKNLVNPTDTTGTSQTTPQASPTNTSTPAQPPAQPVQPVISPAPLAPTPTPPVAPVEPVTPVTAPDIAAQLQAPPDDFKPDELAMLKQRADLMNIGYSNNIGIDALKAKIKAKLDGVKEETEPANKQNSQAQETQEQPVEVVKKPNLRTYLLQDAMKLIRVRIQNLDPKKKDLPGEIFTVANEYIGTVRKFIPYGEVTDNGFHVPNVIYKQLKKRKFLNIKVTKKNGRDYVETNWAPEFALEILPQLTPEELAKLASAQAAAGSVN